MRTMTQSEIAKKLGIVGKQTINFNESVVCAMKPKYMDEYDIECVGIEESKKTTLLVIYKFGSQTARMNWSYFKASEKLKIQKMLQL